MRVHGILLSLLLALALSGPSLSCQRIKTKLGIGDKVTNPIPGTPEKVIQDVLRAASAADEEQGWEQFALLLHTEELDSPAAMNGWRSMKFPSIQRKVGYLLSDKTAVEYAVMDRREDGKSLVIHVENSKSDSATPCKLRQDPAQGNAWRVFNSCF